VTIPTPGSGTSTSSPPTTRSDRRAARTPAGHRRLPGEPLLPAEPATEIEVTQTFIDRCILDASTQTLDEVTAAMAKWWATELHQRVIQRALQLHAGYGCMRE
jgi:alkylation response protein AidB-like acyl-CoA dehydrogenase